MKIIITILLFINIFSLLAQEISYNEEFLINTTTNGWQYSPSVSELTGGKVVICWESEPGDGSGSGIFAQIFSNLGHKVGEEFQVNTYIQNYQRLPSVAGLENGGFVVSWESYEQDGSGSGIYAQIFDGDGLKVGDEFRVNTYIEDWQNNPSICSLNNGGFVISWESMNQDGSSAGIYMQIFAKNGTRAGDEYQVNTYTTNWQSYPSVSNLSNGGFIISWTSNEQDGSATGIFAQLFDEDGSKVGDEFQVNSYIEIWQEHPDVYGLSNDRFLISWESDPGDGSRSDIYAQIFKNDGSRIGEQFRVNTYLEKFQFASHICELDNIGFAICWGSDEQDGDLTGIYTQMYDYNGKKIGEEFQVNTYTSGFQSVSSISSATDSSFIICWVSEDSQDGSGAGVFGKYFPNEPVYHSLINFTIKEPINNKELNINNPLFIWDNAIETNTIFKWEVTYDLYIDTNKTFSNQLHILNGIEDTTYQIDSLARNKTYYWKVLARNYFGDSLWSSDISSFYIAPNATSIEFQVNKLLEEFELSQNYPNPFNPTTKIKYTIPSNMKRETTKVKLIVYDVLGKEVTTLVNEEQSAGSYEVEFNPLADGKKLSSGIYFYRIIADKYSETKKMIFLR